MVTENRASLCTGCGVCVAICPKKCLKMELDANGFYRAVCDESACIQCGLCDKVCPKFMDIKDAEVACAVSAVSKDEKTLGSTSSGGLCYEIAKKALLSGKKVCACVYNYEQHRAEHAVITTVADLEATKGSKYFQSYTADAFCELLDGSEWVVFGAPYQIAAVDAMAKTKKLRDKMLLVDFFCHGTPSMNLWKKYVEEQGGSNIQKIDFRSKEFGWHSFSLRFTYQDASIGTDYKDNMFYTFFFGNYCLGDACYECHFKALKSAADLRVGDFWGEKYRDDKKGVSCCVAFTERGRTELEALSSVCRICDETVDEMLKEQMVKSPACPKQRGVVLKRLRERKKLKTIYNTTLLPYRVKCKIKSILGR